LGDIAQPQDGYFSAAQAANIGIDRHRLQRLVHQGILDRDQRGIYRFPSFPTEDRAELWRAILWPPLRSGEVASVLSHGTALSLYEITTINPSKIDIALPPVRIRRPVPKQYRLHFHSYKRSDITRLHGLPITTLIRTLFDLIVDSSESQFVAEALKNENVRAHITNPEAQRLRALQEITAEWITEIANAKAGK
jgi:predicted transcriptional regulator of viral defense system